MQSQMNQYNEYMARQKRKTTDQPHLEMFADDMEETYTSSEDDLRRPSVLGEFAGDRAIKKGVDPEVGEYQIDLNQPDSFSIAKEMEDHDEPKNRFSSVGFHLSNKDDDYGEDVPEEDELHEKNYSAFRATGMSSNLDVIHEKPDEEVTVTNSAA